MKRMLVMAVKARVELYQVPAWFPPRLQRQFRDVEVCAHADYDRIDTDLAGAEIFVGWSLPPKKLALARNLRWIHSLMTGVAQLVYPEMVTSPIIITNAATVHAIPVAEHAWSLMLALARRIPSAVRAQDRREWAAEAIWDEAPRPFEVGGRTIGIVGFGAIGREVARRARGFGMRVLAVKRRPERGAEEADEVAGLNRLHSALAASDVVVIALPDTPETRALIGASELAAMKAGALLVNVSRGSVIDEAALDGALRSGHLGGAGLDVTAVEPLPAESPLWTAPNLLLTPHLASATERLWARHYDLLADNLQRYLSGQPLLNQVDKTVGY